MMRFSCLFWGLESPERAILDNCEDMLSILLWWMPFYSKNNKTEETRCFSKSSLYHAEAISHLHLCSLCLDYVLALNPVGSAGGFMRNMWLQDMTWFVGKRWQKSVWFKIADPSNCVACFALPNPNFLGAAVVTTWRYFQPSIASVKPKNFICIGWNRKPPTISNQHLLLHHMISQACSPSGIFVIFSSYHKIMSDPGQCWPVLVATPDHRRPVACMWFNFTSGFSLVPTTLGRMGREARQLVSKQVEHRKFKLTLLHSASALVPHQTLQQQGILG